MAKRYTVIIVDDEKLARESIKSILFNDLECEVIGEASDGVRAIEIISQLHPDIVFLDIDMPYKNGIELLSALQYRPKIVFVTAYDSFAIKAFDENAVDYLLKPFTDQRFKKALERAKHNIREQLGQKKLKKILKVLGSEEDQKFVKVISVKTNNRIELVDVNKILWISSSGNYINLHSESRKYLHYESLSKIEEMLDPNQFIRVHRSFIVNKEAIKGFNKVAKNKYSVVLFNGEEVKISRSYKKQIQHIIELKK